ncbi:type II toxin-antitoxin system Phd/YefM family antitoxin [Rhizobium leguminosarum]|uniref:type II toxin-antitoxin system Phd/YefM family antitoxin n=1 Tax=Rhizobium leguminosarum TaxID=384 RepID=UPI001441A41A|nr:type II toxin-antitoxin system prevent-host-death family antitoxin [Rhizobium leguminosarum]NKL09372.1 type II toxin-antitoxin system prevent-host-death family antitoxin [Rhizobium leguminosarum bv. viciae]NKL86196.1 type II toxin-antitoxin system prevent-host-death family antitoxin [Rhizobium leguminosarum bv. viciae]NKL94870.1 type II toxin-antitoxin system prevent-host-death family antitoxin [Rhizobium leguminosarum bv. viciae]NKM95460.1 type II toxin-antitoxin system prevent-host-death f
MSKMVGAAEFKAKCLNLIDQMGKDDESIVITKRGRPVAVLSPVHDTSGRRSVIGAMKGSVLRYDDPLSPAAEAEVWDAVR